jgi:hypothetical protein
MTKGTTKGMTKEMNPPSHRPRFLRRHLVAKVATSAKKASVGVVRQGRARRTLPTGTSRLLRQASSRHWLWQCRFTNA